MNLNNPYQTIALIDVPYLFTRNFRGAGIGAPANYGAERTVEDIKGYASEVDHTILCFDAPPYLRRNKFEPYKAQREERPQEERGQFKGLKAELKRLGFRGAYAAGYEADDCVATLVTAYQGWCPDIRIVTADKDAAQLLTAPNVTQCVPAVGKQDAQRRDAIACFQKFGVKPQHMIMWQALCGDSSDNIPGVKGIGEDKARKVIKTLLDAGLPVGVDGLAAYLSSGQDSKLAMWQAIAAQWNNLALFIDLVTLDRTVPLDVDDLLRKGEETPKGYAPTGVTPMPEEYDFIGNGVLPPEEPEPTGFELDFGPPPAHPGRMTAEEIDQALETQGGAYYPPTTNTTRVEELISPPKPIIGASPTAGQFLRDFNERQQRARNADVAAAEQQNAERAKERAEQDESARNARERLYVEASPVGKQMLDAAAKPDPRFTVQHEPANEVKGNAVLENQKTESPKSTTRAIIPAEAAMLSIEKYGATDAELQPLDLRASWTVSNWIAKSGLYKNFETAERVFAVILRGREMGLDTGTALAGFHVIEGKPSASSDLIRMLAERDPNCEYFYCEHSDAQSSTWVTKHKKHPKERRITYTIEEARRVPSYWKKDRYGNPGNWEIRPEQMLKKTCSSILAREVYAAATLGFYCPEELGNGVIETVGVAA